MESVLDLERRVQQIKSGKEKVLFVHGRIPNPLHLKYASRVCASTMPGDYVLSWQNKSNPSKIRVVLSWLLSAVFFPRRKYDIILLESFQEPVILLKFLGLLPERVKVLLFLTNEATYLLKNNRLSSYSNRWYRAFLKKVDGIICVGHMIEKMVHELCDGNPPPVQPIFNGVDAERFASLNRIEPTLGSNNILIIAHGSSHERVYCKGLDIMLESFLLIHRENPRAKLQIIGHWDEEMRAYLTQQLPPSVAGSVHFMGRVNNLEAYLSDAGLYLHIARGESWGISILEAMRAGVIPLISEWTGAKEVVEPVCGRLVVPLDARVIAQRALEIMGLHIAEKAELSQKIRAATAPYREQNALESFAAAFNTLVQSKENANDKD